METTNPVFSETIFGDWARSETRTRTMTVQGTSSKCLLLLAILTAAAAWTWGMAANGSTNVTPLIFGGLIAGLILALITCFRPTVAPYTSPLYAAAQGLLLGGISYWFNQMYPGIAFNAIALTMGVLLVMLSLYTSRIIPVTEKLRAGIVAATLAVFLTYLVSWVLMLLGVGGVMMIHQSGPIGIVFSLIVVGVAAFNLLLDFDFIERGASQGLPKSMEWYGAFGLLVTLVWLYIAILRLLAKLQRD